MSIPVGQAAVERPRSIGHWVDGRPLAGAGGRAAEVFDPATGEVTGRVALAETWPRSRRSSPPSTARPWPTPGARCSAAWRWSSSRPAFPSSTQRWPTSPGGPAFAMPTLS